MTLEGREQDIVAPLLMVMGEWDEHVPLAEVRRLIDRVAGPRRLMVYEGENAVAKIRDVLGPTDPSKAPGGTVRADFGTDIMVNTAHASDSVENAQREMRIVGAQENNLARIIFDYLQEHNFD